MLTSDFFNPVLIKDLRQHFHEKTMLATLAFLLGGQLLAILFIFKEAANRQAEISQDIDLGTPCFFILLAIYGLAAILLCSLGPIRRFYAEASNPELDYSKFCTMTPTQIVWGKTVSCFTILLFVTSLCLPFMTIAFFLRGISLASIFVNVGIVFVGVNILIQLAILLGSIGKKSALSLHFLLAIMTGIAMIACCCDVNSNILGTSSSPDEVVLRLFNLFCACLAWGLLFTSSIGIQSPPMSNRIKPTRIYLTTLAILAIALSPAIFKLINASGAAVPIDILPSWIYTFVLVSGFFAILIELISGVERLSSGPRILRTCPRALPGRFLTFLFSSGSCNGMALALLGIIVSFIAIPLYPGVDIGITIPLRLATFGFLYVSLAIRLHKHFPKIPPFVSLLLVYVGLACLPFLVLAIGSFLDFLTPFDVDAIIQCLVPNDSQKDDLSIELFILTIGLINWLPIAIPQWRSFKCPENDNHG